jgi:hypothetical protein
MGWIVAVAGLAVSAYSAYSSDKNQKKGLADANSANKEATDATNAANLAMFNRQRGIDKDGDPVNTKLPDWAVMPGAGKVIGYRLKGSAPSAFEPPLQPTG